MELKGKRTEQDEKSYNRGICCAGEKKHLSGGNWGRLPEEVLFEFVLKDV